MTEIVCTTYGEVRNHIRDFAPVKIIAADDPKQLRVGWILIDGFDMQMHVSLSLRMMHYYSGTAMEAFRAEIEALRKSKDEVESESVLWAL